MFIVFKIIFPVVSNYGGANMRIFSILTIGKLKVLASELKMKLGVGIFAQ